MLKAVRSQTNQCNTIIRYLKAAVLSGKGSVNAKIHPCTVGANNESWNTAVRVHVKGTQRCYECCKIFNVKYKYLVIYLQIYVWYSDVLFKIFIGIFACAAAKH